jgi:hypothetical protein
MVALLVGCTTEFDPGLLDAAGRDAGPRDGGVRDAAADGGDAGSDAGPQPCPAVRLLEGTALVPMAEPGPRPMRGATFRDPTFGTCITRISDADADGYMGHVSPVVRGVLDPSANRALPLMDAYRHHLYDLETRSHVSALALYSHQRVRFAAVDDTIWQLAEPFTLVRSTLSGTERARVDLAAVIATPIADGARHGGAPAERLGRRRALGADRRHGRGA